MDQERVAMKVVDVYKVTGEFLLKAMAYLLEEGYQRVKTHSENKVFTDQTNWNKFLATKEDKFFQEFASSELNTQRLADYLKQYEVGFAIKDNKDGTSTIAIDAKNVEALKESFNKVINDLTDPKKAEQLKKNLIKDPKAKKLDEKIIHHEKQMVAEIKDKVQDVTKSLDKIIAKEERGL